MAVGIARGDEGRVGRTLQGSFTMKGPNSGSEGQDR